MTYSLSRCAQVLELRGQSTLPLCLTTLQLVSLRMISAKMTTDEQCCCFHPEQGQQEMEIPTFMSSPLIFVIWVHYSLLSE